jgi:chromate transporter
MPGKAETPTGGGEHAPGIRDAHNVSFRDALRVWIRVAAYSFGGPAGQIAVMQRILVDEKRWFSQNRFLHAMNYTMLLPGPEAQQLATYGGWMLHGWRGGLVAGGLFVVPGFLSILVLSIVYAGFQDVAIVGAVFFGLKPAVLAIVLEAMIRIGRRALTTTLARAIGAGAFIAIFVFGILFPLIIAAAALVGYIGRRTWGDRFLKVEAPEVSEDGAAASVFGDRGAPGERPQIRNTLATAGLWLAIWWVPVVLMLSILGSEDIFVIEALFFSQVAVVTFGGAYAVLAYIAQQAVDVYGWLAPGEMLDGLGMAETTPGPLIQVVQFVGFMGAYRDSGALDPMIAGFAGSVVTTWVTFVPCFLWIFVGAPYIEHLRGRKALAATLAAVTAAVVGVILNLALWFAIHTLFRETRTIGRPFDMTIPVLPTVEPGAVGIGLAAFFVLFGLRWGILRTLGISALLGVMYRTAIGG